MGVHAYVLEASRSYRDLGNVYISKRDVILA